MKRLIFTCFFDQVDEEKLKVLVQDQDGDTVLSVLVGTEGGKDVAAMREQGLEPSNEQDVFKYVNGFLGGVYSSFEWHNSVA